MGKVVQFKKKTAKKAVRNPNRSDKDKMHDLAARIRSASTASNRR